MASSDRLRVPRGPQVAGVPNAGRETMNEPKFRPEDFEAGEVVGVFGPDPDVRFWLTVEFGPEVSEELIRLAGEAGEKPTDFTRALVQEALAARRTGAKI
jgi:hypothetical protein